MSIDSPISILVDTSGNQVGTPSNVLYVTGSATITSTGSLAVSVMNQPVTQSVFVGNTVPVQVQGTVPISAAATLNVSMSNQPTVNVTQTGSFHVTVDNAVGTTAAKASTATPASVAAIVSSQQLLAVNTNRLGAVFYNDSSGVAYVLFGSGSLFTSWTYKLYPNSILEITTPIYTGIVSSIWSQASGSMRVTELT